MFPFQKGDLCFQVSNNNNNDEKDLTETELLNYYNHHANDNSNIVNNTSKLWSGKSLISGFNDNISSNDSNQSKISSGNDVTNKKKMHREIERQRRQEMATLYSSLRSIIPLDYVKGKRSMSDHISEAAKYIKDLEKNVKDLGDKRAQLKGTSCPSSNKIRKNIGGLASSTSSSTRDNCKVSIHSFSKAIKIEICKGVSEGHPFPLSSVLKILSEEGLDVVNCVSKLVNHTDIFVIHCQVEDVNSVGSSQLQWRLNNIITGSMNI